MWKRLLICCFVVSALESVESNPSCPEVKPNMLNVHIISHTHDDAGYHKTVDQYYYGSRKDITRTGVQYILDSVVTSLLKNPDRKFMYVESSFFFRWWNQQNDKMKNNVKTLVDSGQLEFVGGGWTMNDEAASHYNDIIDQMTLGLVTLNRTFGPAAVPRIAWQIDPFGHSKEQASLFAQMGMDGLFFSRLDYMDKKNREDTKQMEMVWRGSNSLGIDESQLFTGVLPHHYSPPTEFCFDLLGCTDNPIMDDPSLEGYNKDRKVDLFLLAVASQHAPFLTSNVPITMGSDFQYVYADAWYKNLDKLIKYVNERQENGSNVNVFYSTPSCYLDALHAANITWPTKTDDFFPYGSDAHAYWTGYFTSRPTLKGFIPKQISALAGIERGPGIEVLAEAMGIAQHHDAVTGTSKQHVVYDYSKRLSKGVAAATDLIQEGLQQLTQLTASTFEYCPLLNISSCPPIEDETSFVVTVYNPIARNRSHYVRLPVTENRSYSVIDSSGNELESQLIPLPQQILELPGRESSAQYELVFYAQDLPPLGAESFLIEADLTKASNIRKMKINAEDDTTLEKGRLRVTLDGRTQKLKTVGVLEGEEFLDMNVTQNMMWYAGKKGTNLLPNLRSSGAYIFRPDGEANDLTEEVNTTADYDGPLVREIHQEWSDWVTQIIRMYQDKNYIEIEWLVGPIPVEDGVGKEIVNRVTWEEMTTDLTFFTDANGREMQKRVKDYRETWNFTGSEPVAQNYYPVTSRLILSSTNGKGQAAIMNDRAQGGTSLADGEMELMVHRRLLHDDLKGGIDEPLNETAFGEGLVARGRHILLHSNFASAECDFGCQHRSLGEELLLQPILTFSSSASFNVDQKQQIKRSGLTSPLPSNLRLLTLEPWYDGKWLLRLENFYEVDESGNSGTVDFDIREMFADWSIVDVAEVTLGANQFKEDNVRLQWQTVDDVPQTTSKSAQKDTPSPLYSFAPMQIRTFIVEAVPK